MYSWFKKRKKQTTVTQTGQNNVAIQNSNVVTIKNTPTSAKVQNAVPRKTIGSSTERSKIDSSMDYTNPVNPLNQTSFYTESDSHSSSHHHHNSHSTPSHSNHDSHSHSYDSHSSSDSYSGGSDW